MQVGSVLKQKFRCSFMSKLTCIEERWASILQRLIHECTNQHFNWSPRLSHDDQLHSSKAGQQWVHSHYSRQSEAACRHSAQNTYLRSMLTLEDSWRNSRCQPSVYSLHVIPKVVLRPLDLHCRQKLSQSSPVINKLVNYPDTHRNLSS